MKFKRKFSRHRLQSHGYIDIYITHCNKSIEEKGNAFQNVILLI